MLARLGLVEAMAVNGREDLAQLTGGLTIENLREQAEPTSDPN